MTTPRILISVINWNGLADTLGCLRAIDQLHWSDHQTLVIDNGSEDDSAHQITREFPQVSMARNPRNTGFAAAHNQSIKYAIENGFEFIWVLNNDTTFAPQTLSALVEAIESDDTVGMVSPIILGNDANQDLQFCGCSIDFNTARITHYPNIESALNAQSRDPASFCLWGTAPLIRTSLLAVIGGFDELFFAYYEDMDLSVRAAQAGFFNRIAPAASIRHGGINDPSLRPPHYAYFNVRNRIIFWKKHLHGRRRLVSLFDLVAGALIYASEWRVAGNATKEGASLLAIRDGLISRGGGWDPARRSPRFIGLNLMLNHPYLFADILRGDFLSAVRRLVRQFRASVG